MVVVVMMVVAVAVVWASGLVQPHWSRVLVAPELAPRSHSQTLVIIIAPAGEGGLLFGGPPVCRQAGCVARPP